MMEIQLTRGKVARVDDADYLELIQYHWRAVNPKRKDVWYAVRGTGREQVYMHKHILGMPTGITDHIDHDGLNNQRYNLRQCSGSQNNANSRKQSRTTSKYKGVYWSYRACKWIGIICKDYKGHHLGSYNTEEDAARAYNTAAIELFGEFALINEIVS